MQRRHYRIAAATLAALAAVAVWTISVTVFPYHSLNHDEAVYLQQAAMLLDGRLFLRPPVEEVFRPWFFVADGGRLYPKYAPVPAAMFALGELLGGGYRTAIAGIAAANVALVVGVVREVFDRPTGLVAGAFVLASPLFLVDSAVFLPYAPTTLLNLLFAYGYLRADRTGDRRWAAVAGAAIGLAGFARPYTAVLFAAPFVGHALWTPRRNPGDALVRLLPTAALGLAGVGVTLSYNAVTTGSPWVFPYEAFAPRDGLGFGRRVLLGHEVRYTPELAVRVTRTVLELFVTHWVAGGLLGAALAAVGLGAVLARRPSPRESAVAGLAVSVVAGNAYFWGNYNLLGDLQRAGDGLVSVLGPYYHFDLLVPTAAFAAVGAVEGARALHRRVEVRFDRRAAAAVTAAVLVAGAATMGAVTAAELTGRLGESAAATDTYEDAYEPFDGGAPENAVVLLPTPYGDWLNHPFQPLRNEPGFDGATVYATDSRPFAVADAFPDRQLYRYVYRGVWAPESGSPDAARLQRIREAAGAGVRLETVVGVPRGATGVTVRVATDEGSVYRAVSDPDERLGVDLVVSAGTVRLEGAAGGTRTLAVEGRDVVRLTVFVDRGAGGSFSYRFDLPVEVTGDRVRALTPRIEYCRSTRTCGGAAAYLPGSAPDGVFARADLAAVGRNA
ncbi:MAG: glycosyltransferase family 39 protein [Halobacteriales archaeon]